VFFSLPSFGSVLAEFDSIYCDLEIGVNGFNPTISRTNCHTHHMTMSILHLLQIGLPVSGMVGYPTEFLGGAHAAKKRHRQTNLLG